jgi:hypothetical protein
LDVEMTEAASVSERAVRWVEGEGGMPEYRAFWENEAGGGSAKGGFSMPGDSMSTLGLSSSGLAEMTCGRGIGGGGGAVEGAGVVAARAWFDGLGGA